MIQRFIFCGELQTKTSLGYTRWSQILVQIKTSILPRFSIDLLTALYPFILNLYRVVEIYTI